VPDFYKLVNEHKAIVARIREMFPDEEDAALADTIEGASDLKEALIFALRQAREAEAFARVIEGMKDDLDERRRRYEARADKLRAAALQAAVECGETKIVAPDFTATVSPGRRKLVITDEAQVPDTFCRVKREPNKAAIMDAIEAGMTPEWATLSNRQPFWTVRTK
jgi:Siphovirus Gp157